jgi:predicted dehydrogenase
MTDRLRAGIIGTGFIGTVHAHAVRASGATVATVAASTPRSAIEAAERLGAAAAEGPLHRVGRVSNVLKHHAVASWLQIGSTKVAMDDSNVAIRLKGLPR